MGKPRAVGLRNGLSELPERSDANYTMMEKINLMSSMDESGEAQSTL